MSAALDYRSFLELKVISTPEHGWTITSGAVNPICKPHQRAIIEWAVRGGRRAIFAKFGLGKTVIMLEIMRLVLEKHPDGVALIIVPLGVRSEFLRDAAMLGTPLRFIRTTAEIQGPGIYLTNYESVREGKIDVAGITAVGLDEAEVLRGFGGTKTFRRFMATLAGDDRVTGIRTDGVPYRFVATATPSPNDYIELLAYAAFLGIMDVGEGKTRFFKRDPAKADNLTLYEHKEKEFWTWISSWGVFLQRPSDLCPCLCHRNTTQHSKDSNSACSPSSHGTQGRETARAHGCADANAEVPSSHQPDTFAKAALPAADASASNTAGKPHDSITSGITLSESHTEAGRNRSSNGQRNAGSPTHNSADATGSAGPQKGCSPTCCSVCRCDEGYDLPPLTVQWHCINAGAIAAGSERDGQHRLIRDAALGVTDASREKRATITVRVATMVDLLAAEALADNEQCIVWCDLNDEQDAIEASLGRAGVSCTSLRGSQDVDERDALLAEWKGKQTVAFVSKPSMYGAGVNLQQCHTMVFTGIGFKARDIIQAVHRIHRFQQEHPCTVHLIYTDAETEVRRKLEAKWQRHDEMMARMSEIIREYGLGNIAARDPLVRTIGVERREMRGASWVAVNNDCVEETRGMTANSVGLICTSIPFGTMYEYSPSYNDFGHTDDDAHFWEQMGYLSPELLRVLEPGRVLAVHVKDRVRPGGLDGWSFQTIAPFHAHAILHYAQQGFAYMGMITVTTDVVRENAQTYRLGWSEQCKDGSKMSVGLPEYILLFRKPPTDASNGYADTPVVKSKGDYSRARWQFDADSHWRSSGNRLLMPSDLVGLEAAECFQAFKRFSESTVYDHAHNVAIADARDHAGQLPPSFKLLQLQSHLPDVWADLVRMRTLNTTQYSKGKEQHVCPFPIDLVQRLIQRFSNAGDVVLDPFGGLGTTALCALEMGRHGFTIELNAQYHADAVHYLRAAEEKRDVPTLFDLVEPELEAEPV